MEEKRKAGRPTDDPKPNKLSFRMSNEDLALLDRYCRQESLTRADGIRMAVKLLKERLR